MDKTTRAIMLVFCVAGFAVFAVLAFLAAGGGRERGVLPEGVGVKYSSVTSSDWVTESKPAPTQPPPGSNDAMVRVRDYAPNIRVDLKYATKHNMTGRRIYTFSEAYLRYGTVKKLLRAQKKLEKLGMGLQIWDAYRPVSAQKKLWKVCPNPIYVADPSKHYWAHSRGNAVDLTLVDSDGTEMVMPTEFDNLTKLADRDYSDIDDAFARENAKLLEDTMKACGFEPYKEEWWHFSDTDSYGVVRKFEPPQ